MSTNATVLGVIFGIAACYYMLGRRDKDGLPKLSGRDAALTLVMFMGMGAIASNVLLSILRGY